MIAGFLFGLSFADNKNENPFNFVRMTIYFLFYIVVTYEIIKQVWKAKKVDKNVFLGLISGYISLGFIGFFICLSIELVHPASFSRLLITSNSPEALVESLMYYSQITLLTIGYGDIISHCICSKAAVLIGLMGQMYLVVITAIIVGKYISQKQHQITNKH